MVTGNKTYISKSNVVLLTISILVFLLLLLSLNTIESQRFEHFVSDYIQSFRTKELTQIMKFISKIGDFIGYSIIIFILGVYLLFKRKAIILAHILAIILTSAVFNIILKAIINRPRPYGNSLVNVTFHSFPSGHAMSAITFYGLMIYLIFKFIKNSPSKIFLCSICIVMILLIGISRIYLGVHYPTDVIAGYMAGLAVLTFSIGLINHLESKTK